MVHRREEVHAMVVLLNCNLRANFHQVARDLPLNVETVVTDRGCRLAVLLPHGAVTESRRIRVVVEGAVVHLDAEEGPPEW